MLEHLGKIEGPFGGVDALYVLVGVVLVAAVIGVTAVVARQVAALTPKPGAASKARGAEAAKAGAEFESWTERPAAQRNYDAEYYSLYGSQPARQGDFVSPRAPGAPPAPATGRREVVAELGPPAAGADGAASAWAPAADWAAGGGTRQAPRVHAPQAPPMEPTGPTDDVVAPRHSRGARAAAGDPWQGLSAAREAGPSFERSSVRPGAAAPQPPAPRVEPGKPAPRASPPASLAPPPHPAAPRPGSARSTFRASPGSQRVVGGGGIGAKEGDEVAPERKAIRCPKCSTVFPGPATRPAMVKCPACGTGGMMK
jgi:hypothetical protein